VKDALEDASSRVATIAQVHDLLWRGAKVGFVELADFMSELCKKLTATAQGHVLDFSADAMSLSADHAIPLGLLINELVTNAVKYAYPGCHGVIKVSAHEIDGHLQVEVSDQGIGLPRNFDIDQPRASLSFKLMTGLVRQLQGQWTISANRPSGARFLVDLPILPKA
jgi:two-component sensor histidine kinase